MNKSFDYLLPIRNMAGAAALVFAAPALATGPTHPLVTPKIFSGNFFTSLDDQQICFDIWALPPAKDPVEGDIVGFKIDPPGPHDDGFVKFTISTDGKNLEWESTNATVLGVVVKGGPNFHLYDYQEAGVDSDHDNDLVSPMHKRSVPQISHYNVCYVKNEIKDPTGCSHGYWRNHSDRWVVVSHSDDFDATFSDAAFTVDLFTPDITLGRATKLGGGNRNKLAREGTAALLNAYATEHGSMGRELQFVNYPFSSQDVIDMIQAAVAVGTNAEYERVGDILEKANNPEGGCPLDGTKALPVP